MDAKEIKSLLKQSREAIKDKEYKTALKNCKAILKADKENYNAWVFLGVAAQETDQLDQAETAFQKAIELSPEQLLAWQGLCNFYEKKADDVKLISCLKHLVKLLENDRAKQEETIDKLISLTKKLGHHGKVFDVLQLRLDFTESGSEKEYETLKHMFAEACLEKNPSSEMQNLQKDVLRKIAESPRFSEEECKKLVSSIETLYKDDKREQAVELMNALYLVNSDSVFCTEFLLKAALDTYIKSDIIVSNVEEILTNSKKNSILPWVCSVLEGARCLSSKEYVKAYEELKDAVTQKQDFIEAWYLITKVQLILHLNSEAENSAKIGLRSSLNNASKDLIGNFYLLHGKALSAKKNWEASLKSLEKCTEVLGRTSEILKTFCYTLLKMGHVEKAQKIYAELHSSLDNEALMLQLEGYMHYLRQEYPVALQKLSKAVSLEVSGETMHMIGCVLWETKEFEKAVKVFAKAAELDPFFAENFMYLGHYYMEFADDKRKAQQCYQKAFSLDSGNEEAVKSLSNVLKTLGNHDENMTVLKAFTKKASLASCKWAWTQLGLYQFERNEIMEAIFSLQNAVRADPFSSYGWECLGDAYLKRGSYESALKAFEKAADLNPSAMYPLYQVSAIQKARGFYEDAVDRYRKLLTIDAMYIPALIGLAETLLLLGKKDLNECLFGRAMNCFQETLNVLARVASVNASFSCLWKLAGDACTYSFHLDEERFPITVSSDLLLGEQDQPALCNKEQLLSLGAKFYGHAITLKENLSNLWQDLGINCYFQSKLINSVRKEDLARKAFICLQKAVSLSPNKHEHWTILGIISVEIGDLAFGQHAFIKSIEIESNNAEAWTNLGILYLNNGNIELSHKSFKVAQSLDPVYPLSWLGQAIIARRVGHSETMDLFRHATTLCSHVEALLGYGRTVCEALVDTSVHDTELYKYNIEQMDAICVASDCIEKYAANNGRNAEAFNILGMLLERQGLHNPALKAYKRSVELLRNLGKTEEIEKVQTNYARLLSIKNEHQEAISEYLKLGKVDPTLLCSFALALYRNKNFEKAYDCFEKALQMSQVTKDKSHILVAMAFVALNIPNAVPKVQSLLAKSSQMQPASVYGLLGFYALGVMNKQPSLISAVQSELLKLEFSTEEYASISMIKATEAYVMNNAHAARNQLLKAIHCHPNSRYLWMQAATSLLQWDSSYAESAALCSEIAVFHGGNKELASQIFALSRLSVGYKNVSLYAAQKALHLRPDELSNWVTLSAACHVASKDRKCIGWIFGFVHKLAKEQSIKPDLLGWLVCMEIFHNILCKDFVSAAKRVKQVSSVSAFSSEIQSIVQILGAFIAVLNDNSKPDALVAALKNHSTTFLGWQLLIKLLVHSGKFSDAERTLTHFRDICSKIFPKLQVYPLLQLAALAYQAINTTEDKEKWLKIGTDCVGEAVKISPNNQASRFLQGIIALKAGNTSLARRSLEKVLYNRVIKEQRWMEKAALQLLVPIYVQKQDKDALQKLVDEHCVHETEVRSLMNLIPSTDKD